MPKKRNLKLFLTDISEAINNIKSYTKDMNYDEFIHDKKTIDAVVRNLEIIGEAAKSIPKNVKDKYDNVNWIAISGMRNKLIHEYFGVSVRIVWETLSNDIPNLEEQINNILDEF